MTPSNDEPVSPHARGLPIPALKVQQYRNFGVLDLEELTRVNLITGRNNVGKSSLLEAVHLLASRGAERALLDVLKSRGELKQAGLKNALSDFKTPLIYQSEFAGALAWSTLLTPHAPKAPARRGFVISVPKTGRWLLVRVGWYRDQAAADGGSTFREFLALPETDTGMGVEIAFGKRPGKIVSLRPSAAEEADLGRYYTELAADALEPLDAPESAGETPIPRYTSRFCPPHGVDTALVARLWNEIVLSPTEGLVIEALRLIDRRVQRCALIGEPAVPHVLLEGMDHPLPIAAMGDGMGRLFNLAVLLAASRNGVVCIDDIDIGLHYTVLEALWRFVLAIAEQLDVQVFATTHSRESIEAFAAAMAGRGDGLGQVIKLYRSKAEPHRVEAACFGHERLELALSSDLEVR